MKKKQDIISEVIGKYSRVIKRGYLNEKVLLGLKMNVSLYPYIEVITNYYDSERNPDSLNWTDVEGMGYGWAWLNYPEDKWHKMMGRIVSDECDMLLNAVNDTYYVIAKDKGKITYHFITFGEFREDTIITLSHKKLYF